MTTEWYENRHNVADFLKWLFDTARLSPDSCGIDAAIHIVRYPKQYSSDFRTYLFEQKEAACIVTESRSMPDDGSQEQVKDELAELGWC